MTDPEIAELFAFASSLWPNDVAPGSEAVRLAWSNSLARFDASMLASVLVALAEHEPKFPNLAKIVDAYHAELDRVAKAQQASLFRLEAEPTTIDGALAAFDASAVKDRRERHEELTRFIAGHPGAVADIPAARARIDSNGYVEGRARAMLERGVPPGVAGKELYYSLSDALAKLTRGTNA